VAKKYVTLIFHKGAILNDKTGLLKRETRTARFYDMKDVKRKRRLFKQL
jgi:hypothetical protein